MAVNPFNKLLLVLVTVLAVGVGVAVAAGTNGGSSSGPANTVVDVKGPCDEAEHANDPECPGAQVPEDNNADEQGEDANDDRGRGRDHAEDDSVADNQGEDISGPCDEAEHANDPSCTGAGAGVEDQGEVEDQDDDNSGPSANSGPGSSHDDNDHSGHGGGDDSGQGSDDGGNSGPGGGDDD